MSRLFLAVFLVFSCSTIPVLATSPQTLRIHGSNTVGASLAPALAEAWLTEKGYTHITRQETGPQELLISAQNSDAQTLNIEIHAHGSSTSFKDLAASKADIGMSSRPIKAKEVRMLASLGDMTRAENEYVIALDGLSVIVHPKNPLNSINKNRLQQIFAGKITHWSQLGIAGGRIKVHARDDKSGTYDTFKSLVLGKKTPLVANARRYESNARLADDVAVNRNAIGFVGLAYVRKAKALAISDGDTGALKPLPFNVSTEDYALARRLFLYVPDKTPHPLAKSFAEFAISAAAQSIVDRVGFVSQKIHARQYALPTHAPVEYHRLTRGGKRLSLNIRFRQGDVKLDNKAVRDVKRLVEFVRHEHYRRQKIMLFGFSDSYEGLPYASLSLSISRADTVADEFVKQRIIPAITRGFGAELPVASNNVDAGRQKNRRVEVWIK